MCFWTLKRQFYIFLIIRLLQFIQIIKCSNSFLLALTIPLHKWTTLFFHLWTFLQSFFAAFFFFYILIFGYFLPFFFQSIAIMNILQYISSLQLSFVNILRSWNASHQENLFNRRARVEWMESRTLRQKRHTMNISWNFRINFHSQGYLIFLDFLLQILP